MTSFNFMTDPNKFSVALDTTSKN